VTFVLQVSDPHFGTHRPHVVQALLRFAAAQAPDIVVLSGDITQRARSTQFAAAREFVDALPPAAVVAIPGNHDIPLFDVLTRAVRPYRNYMRCFGAELEPVVDARHARVIGVNTTRRHRHKHGEVSAAQVERVELLLRQARPDQVRIVVVHQPVLAARASDAVNVLRGAERAVRAWAAAGNDVIIGGHIHLPYVRALCEQYPGLDSDCVTAQAGTAVSSRVRIGAPNSVNVLRCAAQAGSRRCVIERWDHNDASNAFELRECHEFVMQLAGGAAVHAETKSRLA
jgi:3',5'-cyclic AMP phosphodiesterase CpdA